MSFSKSNIEIEEFLKVFEIIKNDIVESLKEKQISNQFIDWTKLNIEVNCIGGKYMRGLTVINTVKEIMGSNITDELLYLSSIAGWCIEIFQGSVLISDDIMDGGTTRRGHPCWHRYPNPITNTPIGNIAVNDSFILESFIYFILKKNFKNKPYYSDLFDLFQEITHNTYLGQLLDTSATIINKGDLSTHTFKDYMQVIKYKNICFSLLGPVNIGLILCHINHNDPKFNTMKDILFQMGEMMSAQDDYLDLYGDPKITGKVGSDIQENKRTWFIAQALKIGTSEQIQLLKNHYGINDQNDIDIVKKVYNEIGLESIYKKYEEDQYYDLLKKIEIEKSIPKEIYLRLLNGTYKRNK